MDLKAIGKRIKEKRLERSWSQENLSEKVGLSPVYIGMIERGEKQPKLETFIRIANALNVSADEILADVLIQGYKIKVSKYTEQIASLSEAEQKRLFNVIEAFLNTK
ncbi:MAG: helix-turn-helix transcriptional regulator [Bacteroides sp.]|nr:helix-turn-helix transcriptional regulator [Bacteroides sp.]MCM1548829.1 helix-turn-helix transcriptional regulator [Clostridium sp.]